MIGLLFANDGSPITVTQGDVSASELTFSQPEGEPLSNYHIFHFPEGNIILIDQPEA